MIRELPGEPNERRPNQRHPERADFHLYLLACVEDAERTDTFFERLDRSEKRKDAGANAGAKAVQTRLARVTGQVEGLEIALPTWERDELIRQACTSYNAWVTAQGAEREPATPQRDEWFLAFISVNVLRHGVQGYRELYDRLHRQPEAAAARRRLDERIYQTIAQTYPERTPECERQNKRKLFPTPQQQAQRERLARQRQEAKQTKRR